MKATFLTLLTFILLAGCTTDETNEIIEANTILIIDNDSTREVSANSSLGCYNVYFDPTIYTTPESIPELRNGFYLDGSYWNMYIFQPSDPYHQIWCPGPPRPPNGEESENDPPTGVTFIPVGGYGG
jgi:hypothetical protein